MTRLLPLALAFGLGLVVAPGCDALPWGSAGLGEAIDPAAVDPHGLSFFIGADGAEAASARLDALLPAAWDDGVALSGEAVVESAASLAALTIRWRDLVMYPGPVVLTLVEDGLLVEMGLRAATTELSIDDGASALCRPTVTIDGALMTLRLTLSADKRGRVQATLVDSPLVSAGGVTVGFDGCLADGVDLAVTQWADTLVTALARDVVAALGPALVAAIPEAMKLGVSLGVASTVAADAIGAGLVRVTLEATQSADGPAWGVHGGLLRVPFAVGLDVEHHPCVPALALTPIAPAPLPAPEAVSGRELRVSGAAVQRAIQVAWLSGVICGPRATRDAWLEASVLAAQWPALSRLPDDTSVRMHLWPRGLPHVTLSGAGGGEAVVSTGPLEIDLYAEIDDADVRLVTVEVEAEVAVAIAVGADGAVTATATDATVRGLRGEAGLLLAPSDGVIARVVTELLLEWLDTRRLFHLPGGATPGAAASVTVRDGYLSIGH